MSPPVVLIIGCGIAGPVLGNFYKRKGYHPIVFEKVPELGDAGASLMLMSNGLKVLNLVGLADKLIAESTPLEELWDASQKGEVFGRSDLPSTFGDQYHQPAVGVRRTTVNLKLKEMLIDIGVDVREGWELTDIQENENSVKAFFNGGRSVTGSFLIGCDGIKSASRRILLKNQGIPQGAPVYTGLTQTAGISLTPEPLRHISALRNWYGDGIHVISYPVGPNHSSWAITQRETQEKEETWRPYRADEIAEQKQQLSSLLHGWDPVIQEMVHSAERIIKFGLFDRKELEPQQWHSKRCVLVGDAAHPTSPHLGQGANQALEDCFHLSHSMPFLDAESEEHCKALQILESNFGDKVFRPFAEKRQPRTSLLVKGARAQGNRRVTSGIEACRQRDSDIRASFKDSKALSAKFDNLLREPFQIL
ncbi:monooxygenase FAD-binding protein [Fusarium heterosporum]|uniref:Monooxygenase FAD-binding protein n=1 Tax=Fusarium heterosporum TaxID=42747 RepID=A0A8H5U5C2_FUSHE|nr:monooxygenase FAD-binding protein [Fusarium heterosporum]